MEAALYDASLGFFAQGGGAGRRDGDFMTSPEVGSLFGALVARQLDLWWESLDRPDPFVVVDAGAGRGQLARDVLRAQPECARALRYVMVERSAALRRLQHEHLQVEPPEDALGPAFRRGPEDDEPKPVPGIGPIVTQTESFPAGRFIGAVIANELLDNLPFRMVHRTETGWDEVRVGLSAAGAFTEALVPAEPSLSAAADDLAPWAEPGARLPVQTGIEAWFRECGAALTAGFVAVVDYVDSARGLADRGVGSWLRTYRAHSRGGPPIEAPGTQDITCDVVLEAVLAAARRERLGVVSEMAQADWLRALGIDTLVDEGRQLWREGAHIGDLRALGGRSRVSEAAALLDPEGLGGHRVVVLSR